MAIPNMGVHWLDSFSAELHGHKFTSTFVYGFYHGEMYFAEPMITKVFLGSRPKVTLPVK